MKHKREIIESKYPPKNNEDIWLKNLLLYASTAKGWLPLGSEKTYSNKTELLKDTPIGGTIGIDKETGTAYLYNDVSKEWTSIGGGGGITEITWQELKDKRDDGELIPGSLYRITDYQCTTTQENTRSAGHQFDIVLLALSEDKLAEEGWAMMHDNDVYDVTFTGDNVALKCYIYQYDAGNGEVGFNVVRVDNFLGLHGLSYDELTINEELHTATASYQSTDFDAENLQYSYFQNSNLSAWKVWYCLDNDKSRFAWAMDKDYIKVLGGMYYRNPIDDIPAINLFGWYNGEDETLYTNTDSPQIGDYIYSYEGEQTEMTIEKIFHGRGVIYRLIDEWNNDVGYDFKNIQFVRKLTDGELDTSTGTDTWCYTFNGWDGDNSACIDATTDISLGFNDIHNNIQFIGSLGDNVFLGECNDIKIMDTECGLITLSNCLATTLIATYIFELADENGAIYIANKKVLTEE